MQRNLLKLMEEAEVDLKTPHDLASQVEAAMEAQRTGKVTRKKINTRNILFIVSGAFGGLLEIIRRRQNLQAIGFSSEHAPRRQDYDAELLKKVRTEDLIEFGFESEFVGRLPVTVVLNDVTEETLYRILTNRYSTVVNGKKMDFKAYGIDLDFTDGALRKLAKMALGEKTGARGLLNVFEKTLISFEKTLPSLTINSLLVDEAAVDAPRDVLRTMMVHDSLKSYQANFLTRHGIFLQFAPEAIDLIADKVKAEQKSFISICEDLFHDYAYGIRLMQLEEYTITADAVRNPVECLERDIRRQLEIRGASGEQVMQYSRG